MISGGLFKYVKVCEASYSLVTHGMDTDGDLGAEFLTPASPVENLPLEVTPFPSYYMEVIINRRAYPW